MAGLLNIIGSALLDVAAMGTHLAGWFEDKLGVQAPLSLVLGCATVVGFSALVVLALVLLGIQNT